MSRMSMGQEENDIYIIPPNFIDTGTIFGGTIKLRNAVEALILALLIGVPVFQLPVTLTTKIIIVCLTVLPAGLFAIIGIGGESLSSFVINFFVYLKNRRIVGITAETEASSTQAATRKEKAKAPKSKKKVKPKKEDFAEEFGQRKEKKQTKQSGADVSGNTTTRKRREPVREEITMFNPCASYLPIRKIENGIIWRFASAHYTAHYLNRLPQHEILNTRCWHSLSLCVYNVSRRTIERSSL